MDEKLEMYWIRGNGEEVPVGDMNEYHAKACLRQLMLNVIQGDRQAVWESIGQAGIMAEEINSIEDVA